MATASDFPSAGLSFVEGAMKGFDFVDRIHARKQDRQDRADAKSRQSMLDDREESRYQQGLQHRGEVETYQRGRDTQGDLERAEGVKREDARHQDAMKREDRNYNAGRSDKAYERTRDDEAARATAAAYTFRNLLPMMETDEGLDKLIQLGYMGSGTQQQRAAQTPENTVPGITSADMLNFANAAYGTELQRGSEQGHHGPAKIGAIHVDPKDGHIVFGVDYDEGGKSVRIGRKVPSELVGAQAATVGALAEELKAADPATRKKMIEAAWGHIASVGIAKGVSPDVFDKIRLGNSGTTESALGKDVNYIAKVAGVDGATALTLYKAMRSTAKPEDLAGKLIQAMTARGDNPKDIEKNLASLMAIHKKMQVPGTELGGPGAMTAAPDGIAGDDDLMGMMGLGQ